jgi:hypothetical protein
MFCGSLANILPSSTLLLECGVLPIERRIWLLHCGGYLFLGGQ